jgi:HEAT repeat protein
MKRKTLCLILGGLIFWGTAFSWGAEEASGDKEMDQFFKGKALVYAGDWPGVRSDMETYLKDYPVGKMRDEALYWLGRSLDRLAREARDVASTVDLKQKAFASLDRLIMEFPGSVWRDDAKELQITIAGGLAVLGVENQREFLEKAVRSGGKDGIEIKTAALDSIIILEAGTAIPVLRNFLKTESDAGLRKHALDLLGRKYDREVTVLFEETAKNDPDTEVRKNAEVWLGKIRTRLIPVQVNYYCFDTRVTDPSAYASVPEGKIALFTIPHGRPGSESRARKAIKQVFRGRLDFAGSMATMSSGALEEMGSMSQVSHKIGGFRIELDAASIIKTADDVAGRVRFDDSVVSFKVDGTSDVILAARRGERQAVMFLEMAPKDVEEDLGEENPSPAAEPQSASSGREPFYSTSYNFEGLVVFSTRSSVDSESLNANVLDFSLAKAEIHGSDGTWTLTGQLLLLKKEQMLVGRAAKLFRPDGTTAAAGGEIRVPVGNPAGFKVGSDS